jgi:hypothetical protein
MRTSFFALCGLVLLAVANQTSHAGTITLNATDSGWFSHQGFHNTIGNYIVGNEFANVYHNYFVFDLSGVTETIIGAQLRLFNPSVGYNSPDATETFGVFDVSTPIGTLTANSGDSAANIVIYNDLGSGIGFGSQTVSAADANAVVSVMLNAAAIASTNAASSQWAIGGAITTLQSPPAFREYAFGGTLSGTRQLVLETQDVEEVPEPTSLTLLSLGALGLAGAACRRRQSA